MQERLSRPSTDAGRLCLASRSAFSRRSGTAILHASSKLAGNWLYRAARKGNVAAIKRLDELMRAAQIAGQPAKPEPLGKKAQARLEADTVDDGDWGRLLMSTAKPNCGERPRSGASVRQLHPLNICV
jgi:hypothetical protein